MTPVLSIIIGVGLMIGSWLFMFAIILNLLASTFAANFLIYAVSMVGLAIAFRGGYLIWLEKRSERDREEGPFSFSDHPDED